MRGHRCAIGPFTSSLTAALRPHRHTGKPDNIMKEIPTVVVSPMPESFYPHMDYVVLNRPYAVRSVDTRNQMRQ